MGPGGAAGLQSTDNCQFSTVGVNLVYLSSGKKKKKKVGCNLKILRLTRKGGVVLEVGGGSVDLRRRQGLRRVQGSVLAELGWDREGTEKLPEKHILLGLSFQRGLFCMPARAPSDPLLP